jgi:CxxC-x17-CxxC domain-containing protein
MTYQDRTLSCQECGQSFNFSADDQAFHADKGFTNEPKRCPTCRQARRNERGNTGFGGGGGGGGGGFDRGPREMFPAVCAECGKDTMVPFQPRNGRPVYCSDCFSRQNQGSSGRGRY